MSIGQSVSPTEQRCVRDARRTRLQLAAGGRTRVAQGAKASNKGIRAAKRWCRGVMLEASCVVWDAGLILDPLPDTAEIFGTSPLGLP